MELTKPKFYLLEYFYVLLKSVKEYSDREQVFERFKVLKQEHKLGQSKYKTFGIDPSKLTEAQVVKYKYTFEGVIEEARSYGLVEENPDKSLSLKPGGHKLLTQYEERDFAGFYQSLMTLMEGKHRAFRYIIQFLYETNEFRSGLLVFPIYSPRQLGFEKPTMRKTSDLIRYTEALVIQLQEDVHTHLRVQRDLKSKNAELISTLRAESLLSSNPNDRFDPKKYDVVTKRCRDFWIKYFLEDIYDFKFSWSSFERWIYRGKQCGIIHATDYYPHFNGKLVYPTSVVVQKSDSKDFTRLYTYRDGFSLYAHIPKWDLNQNEFLKSLVDSYFDLRRSDRSIFISLPSVREVVCYKLRISERVFETFLDHTYKLNLAGKLGGRISISLEADKLPEETKAQYLVKEPVMIDGKYRNIIAIDVAKGEILDEQTIKAPFRLTAN
jgi:hypothetical protein